MALEELADLTFLEIGPPRYEQLATHLERAIRAGELAPGDRLPTVRQLSTALRLSATTVSAAIDLLRTRKFVKAEVGRGTFVATEWQEPLTNTTAAWTPRPAVSTRAGLRTPWRRNALMRASSRLRASYPEAMECSTGRPDPKLLPLELIRTAWGDCLNDISAADLQYAAAEPIRALSGVLMPILEKEGIAARPEDLIIGNSAQQFFALIHEVALSRAEGQGIAVAVEEPGYPTLLDTLERAGARLIGMAVDHYGVVPASLYAALEAGAQMAVLTPRGHNPTGASWSVERLRDLTDVLQAFPRAMVVEDDQMAGIATTRPGSLISVPELESRVLYVRSFSKSIAPDLRMALGVARSPLRDGIAEAKSFADGWSSRLLQRVLAKVLSCDAVEAALGHARDAYQDRRRSACKALNSVAAGHSGAAWFGPDGVNVWVTLPPGVDSKDMLERCAAAGVRIADGEPFFVAPGRSDVVRLNAGSVMTEDAAKAGHIVGKTVLDCGRRKPGPIHV